MNAIVIDIDLTDEIQRAINAFVSENPGVDFAVSVELCDNMHVKIVAYDTSQQILQ